MTTTVERVYLRDDFYPNRNYPLPSSFAMDWLADDPQKWEVLAQIGITPEGDETPLQAWRNEVQRRSGEQVGVPVLDLGFSPAFVRKFALFLA